MSEEKLVHPNLKILRDSFNNLQQSWLQVRQNIKSEPSQAGVPNTTIQDFDETLTSVNRFLQSDEASLLFNPVSAGLFLKTNQWQNWINNIQNLSQQLQNNPSHWAPIFDHLHTLLNSLTSIFYSGPNYTPDKHASAQIAQKVGQISSSLKESEHLLGRSRNSQEKIEALVSKADELLKGSTDRGSRIEEELRELQQYKQGLNQKGLGEAFGARAKDLGRALIGWVVAFSLAIGVICTASLVPTIAHVLKSDFGLFKSSPESVEANEKHNNKQVTRIIKTESEYGDLLLEVLKRLLMTSPAIWFAWFSGRQYSITKRLKEEYEFKRACAMAYYGYSQEAAQAPELKEALLRGAIDNFNSSPDKVFESKAHVVSPLEDLIKEALKKADPTYVEKVLDAVLSFRKS